MEALRLSVTKKGGPDPSFPHLSLELPLEFFFGTSLEQKQTVCWGPALYYSEMMILNLNYAHGKIIPTPHLSAGPFFCLLDERADQFRFLGNCPPTRPLTQHFAPSETQMLTLS